MRDHTQFNIRIPNRLKKELDDSARLNNRSTNAEAISRLESSFHGGSEQALTLILSIVKDIHKAVKHD